MAILSFFCSKIGRICTIFENFYIYLTQCTQSVPKIFEYGGGDQWLGGVGDKGNFVGQICGPLSD